MSKKKNNRKGFLILFLLAFFPSCASVEIKKPDFIPASLSLSVPLLRQGEKECVPVSILMILEYFGINKSQDELKVDLRWNPARGVLTKDIVNFPAEKYGLKTFVFWQGSLDELTKQIAQGRPVLVRMWIDEKSGYMGTVSHSVIAIGYDYSKSVVYLNDPSRGLRKEKFSRFLDLWDMTNHIYMNYRTKYFMISFEKLPDYAVFK